MSNKRHKLEQKCICGARQFSQEHGACHLDALTADQRLQAATCLVHHQFVAGRTAVAASELGARSRDERSEAFRTKYVR